MSNLLESLNRLFATKSQAEIAELWAEGDYLDSSGIKVTDFLKQHGYSFVFKEDKINFGNLPINDNLGSESYSNLFFYITFFYDGIINRKDARGIF